VGCFSGEVLTINARRRAHKNLTLKEREEINARRRAHIHNLTLEEREAINARRRAQSQNLTPHQREEINACRRARRAQQKESRKNMAHDDTTVDERRERNARQRARRKSIPPEEQRALLDQRNARYAARRDTPCKESLALQCSMGSSVGRLSSCSNVVNYPSTIAQACTTAQGNYQFLYFLKMNQYLHNNQENYR
jgi:hypothetical protein